MTDASSKADQQTPAPAEVPSWVGRAAATVALVFAAVSFVMPTVFGAAMVGYGAQPSVFEGVLEPLFHGYALATASEFGFVREFWTAIPALLFGIFAALPRMRNAAFFVLLVVMIFVAFGGSIVLHYDPAAEMREVSTLVGGDSAERLTVLGALPEAIRQSRTIAVTFLVAAIGKIAVQKSVK